jgi:mannose-6-phosphate isomerase-like protein (cupin superfamily)
MQLVDTDAATGFFDVVADASGSQAATMILAPGQSTGGPDNRHERSDQWLYVKSGHGIAVVDGDTHDLRPGALVCIERGETHEIRNDGEEPLETVNVYAPPVY